jgi:hypothetical protein
MEFRLGSNGSRFGSKQRWCDAGQIELVNWTYPGIRLPAMNRQYERHIKPTSTRRTRPFLSLSEAYL